MTKLLILEHSKSVRNNLCERLEFEGYATQAVETVAAAEVIAGQEPIDLLISDDVEALPSVDCPMIIISTKPSFERAVEAMHRGAVDFLTKPIDMNRLLTSIRNSVEQSEAGNSPCRNARRTARNKKCGTAIHKNKWFSPVQFL